jgi:hypothetical protein
VISGIIIALPAVFIQFNLHNFLITSLVASVILNIIFFINILQSQPNKHDSKDEQLFVKINTLFDFKEMDSFTNDLSNGYVSIEDKDRFYKLLNISRYDKFLNSNLQHKFIKLTEVLKSFDEFFDSEFSKEGERGAEQIEIHKYRDIPDGHEKCDENFRKAQNFANQIYQEYEKLNDAFRKSFPETYVWQEVRHTPMNIPSLK